MIQQSASYRRSTLRIYVNHCLLVLGVLSARFVFVNQCCLKAVSRSLSTPRNLHLNCSTSISWCNALGRAGRTSSPRITYLPLFFKQQAKKFVLFFFLKPVFFSVMFSLSQDILLYLVLLVLVFVCYLVFLLNHQACQPVYMIAGSKTKTRNIPLRGVSQTFIGQISAC